MRALLRLVGMRLVLVVPVLFLVSVATFLLVELVPGDPAVQVLGENSTPAEYQRIHEELGLDQPIVQRYGDWASDVVRGDFGRSLIPPVEDVSTRLARALPVNIELAGLALVISLAVAVPLGMWSAYRVDSRFDRFVSGSMFGLISLPGFLAGILLLLVLAINWRLFPLGRWARLTEDGLATNLHHAILPALTLALTEIAVFTRLLRNDMITTLQQDFILASRAKGMRTFRILWSDALRPSSFSLVTLAGVSLGRLIGGTVIVEAVFDLPGVGRTIIDAALRSDFPVVQGGVIVVALIYVSINLVVEVLYGYLDPRIRHGIG